MLAKMLIRKKILYSTILLTATLLLLMYCSLRGVYAYRGLTINISTLSGEFKNIWQLQQGIDDLRIYLRPMDSLQTLAPQDRAVLLSSNRGSFFVYLEDVKHRLNDYEKRRRSQLVHENPLLAPSSYELETIHRAQSTLRQIDQDANNLEADLTVRIDEQLELLGLEIVELFNYQTDRMSRFRAEMRSQYHTWIAVITVTALASLFNVGISFWFFRHSVVQPFKLLLSGSRDIAGGKFDHRIRLKNQDELAELALAMNSMTDRFVQIKDHLNEKVQQRTQEVVRSEQLASVGFLAAGVAHEINNPLASIAWSAEALESRLHDVINDAGDSAATLADFDQEQIDVLRKYLRRIQEEAFRCKGITERLLDFSRLGESQIKQETDIHEAVSDVIALVKHLGQYKDRSIVYQGTPGLMAIVSPTELKQVVLNLLTNALDASDDGGQVLVTLDADDAQFILRVKDEGCGMTSEVMQHLFEPFFTRRRDGRGTGLGLSISYRIVQDHGGMLVPSSEGPGAGSTLQLVMPIQQTDEEEYGRLHAA